MSDRRVWLVLFQPKYNQSQFTLYLITKRNVIVRGRTRSCGIGYERRREWRFGSGWDTSLGKVREETTRIWVWLFRPFSRRLCLMIVHGSLSWVVTSDRTEGPSTRHSATFSSPSYDPLKSCYLSRFRNNHIWSPGILDSVHPRNFYPSSLVSHITNFSSKHYTKSTTIVLPDSTTVPLLNDSFLAPSPFSWLSVLTTYLVGTLSTSTILTNTSYYQLYLCMYDFTSHILTHYHFPSTLLLMLLHLNVLRKRLPSVKFPRP